MKPDDDEPYDGPTRPVVRRAAVVDAPTAPEPTEFRTPDYGTPGGSESAPAYGTPPPAVAKSVAPKGRKQSSGKQAKKAQQKAALPAKAARPAKRRPSPAPFAKRSPAPRRIVKSQNIRAKRKRARAKARSAAAIKARGSNLGGVSAMVGITASVFTFGVPEYGPAVVVLASVGLVLGGFVLIRRRTTLVGAVVGVTFSAIAITIFAVLMGVTAREAH